MSQHVFSQQPPSSSPSRLVVLVDEHDQPIGEAGLEEAHQGKGMLHRASSVFLFRKNAQQAIELLLQQRSPQKIVAAKQWANTVCGNVVPGETYQQCAQRRLEEELGIVDAPLTLLTKYRYQVQCNEHFSENEMDTIFAGWYDGEVIPNSAEVMKTAWVSWRDIQALFITKKPEFFLQLADFAPWVPMMFKDQVVRQSLEGFLKENR